jgi:ribosomal protein L12E/L44/L45/RPP1/RPP2
MTSNISIDSNTIYWTTQALADKLLDCIICRNNRSKYLAKAVAVIYNWTEIEGEGEEVNEKEKEEEEEEQHQNHIITFELRDILNSNCEEEGQNVVRELLGLIDEEHAESTFDSIMHKTTKRLFEMISAGWFYESTANQILVELRP